MNEIKQYDLVLLEKTHFAHNWKVKANIGNTGIVLHKQEIRGRTEILVDFGTVNGTYWLNVKYFKKKNNEPARISE